MKDENIIFRLTKKEKEQINKRYLKSNYNTKSDFYRDVLLKTKIIDIDTSILNKYVFQISAIGNNINQIAKKVNTYDNISYSEYKELIKYLENLLEIKENLLVKEGYFRWVKKNNFFVKMNIRNKMLEDYGIKDQEELIKKYIDNEDKLKNIYKDNRYLFGEIKKIKKEIASLKRIKGEVSINRSITLYEKLNELQEEVNINNQKINEFKIENVDIVIMDKKLNEIEEVEDNTYERIQAEREKQRAKK